MAETVRAFFALEASASDALCAEARTVVNTLARIKTGHFRESDAEGIAAAGAARLRVNEIVLLRSELRPDGALYTPLEHIALQERAVQGGNVHP